MMVKKKQQQQAPWVVQFNGTSKPALVAPFDGCQRTHAIDMAALQGKQCLGLDGDWSVMLDELTDECSLVSLANTSPLAPTVIPLPQLPEDTTLPPSYLRFGCALSNQTPPDCTVLLDFVRDKSFLYCRPGDAEWSRLPVELEEEQDGFDGPITPCHHHGKVYATTMASLVAVGVSRPEPAVEKTDHRRPPPCPVHAGYKCFPVPCPNGELFLVRCCYFDWLPELVDVKLFRWSREGNVWEMAESIGDQTFFLGRFSFVVPSAAEAGTQPNCVHVLEGVGGKYGIYTVSLDDMTTRLTIVEGCERDEDDGEEEAFWALPTSFGLLEASGATDADGVPSEVMQQSTTEHCCKEEERKDMLMSSAPSSSPEESQWSDLQTDLLQLLVTKISFIDFLHLKAVCKQWNSITSPIQDAKVAPLLMTTRPRRTKQDLLEVFDPLSNKKYNLSVSIPASDIKSQGSQLLHFTKNGWVIVSRGGDHMFFLVNPFKNYQDGGDVIALPPLHILGLKGLSFSTIPGSPDFVVLAVGASADGTVVTIQTWRIGEEDWKEEFLGDAFRMASHSPVFLDGVFYFLDINGRLGVLDPNEMEWNVLEKPDQPIRGSNEVHTVQQRDYSYLVEWKGELVAILRESGGDDGSIRIFKLDQPRMVWTELEGMNDSAVFWDKSNALIAMLPPREDLCNKVYLPNYTESKANDGGRAQAFYSLKERQYYLSVNAKEPTNAIWFQPKLEDLLCRPSVS